MKRIEVYIAHAERDIRLFCAGLGVQPAFGRRPRARLEKKNRTNFKRSVSGGLGTHTIPW